MTLRLLATSAVSCAVLALLLAAGSARASCNVIPDSKQTIGGTPQGKAVAATIPDGLSYRGALGRIDKAVLSPAKGSAVVVGPDPGCAGRPLRPLSAGRSAQPGDVVARLTYASVGGEPVVQYYGSSAACDAIQPRPSEQRRGERVYCDPAEGNVAIGTDPVSHAYRLRISASPHGVPGPVSLTVVAATPSEIANLLDPRFANDDCAAFAAGSHPNPDRYICIDKIYDDYLDRCAVGPKYEALVPANLLSLPAANDFHEQCLDEDDADTQLEPCVAAPVELAFAVDSAGTVLVPFDWTEIRKQADHTLPSITRIVAGMTAAARKEMGKDPGVWIPGREFVGSTPIADPGGSSTDFRKPEVAVWRPADRPNEIGFIGAVDKDDSILHVYPRMSVGWRCDSYVAQDEACMAVEQFASGGVEVCALDDRSGMGATCEALLVPEFAACEGGDFDEMPCTRPNHCGFFGTCSGVPKCQKKDEVWEPNKNKGSGACKTDGDCAANEQCGYSLFDLSDRAGKNLTAKVKSGSGNKVRRGACDDASHDTCSNAGGGNSCSGNTECLGYRLEAHGKK